MVGVLVGRSVAVAVGVNVGGIGVEVAVAVGGREVAEGGRLVGLGWTRAGAWVGALQPASSIINRPAARPPTSRGLWIFIKISLI